MVQLKHFIITQFNLRLWSKDKLNRSTVTEEWLANRFVLFEKYCLPSILNQVSKDFIWLCLFDENTPKQYIEKVNSYRKLCPQLTPCYLNDEETSDWLEYTKRVMRSYLTNDDKYIITTNLDNDDSIHSGMVNFICEHVDKNQPDGDILYSFNYGYQYFTDLDVILKMVYPHNHFLSLVEKNTPDFKTIKVLPHAKARKYYKTIDIKNEPYWIEFVHRSNVNNDLRITSRIKYYPVFRNVSLRDFGLYITIRKSSSIFNILLKMPLLFSKTAVRKLKKKFFKKKTNN
ncbi:putative rhamnosyl transferase [Dysgonomonas sp. OttesenSCG-928-M03]|nr:putative rhamnosyl transferase [Dysgonomonas sp. OttesenSCG-928-M03]